MKKQFLNLGKALSKAEQKEINGGGKQLKLRRPDSCDEITEISRAECFCLYFSICEGA
ncbi:hypothetical protein [Lutibacter sp.]|uniref:hypothetical protein n=1 Tax=Lutibacter sp. TaxID=1925666 RepID=UPI0025C48EAA|nr:hypothetical protein [Lutibacter sp.]MCF6181072.1 hypothetical protein [Lutibacter sp.]